MIYIGYMNVDPNFSALSQALYAAVSLNDTSALDYSTIADEYTAGTFVALPIVCLDEGMYTCYFVLFRPSVLTLSCMWASPRQQYICWVQSVARGRCAD